MGAAPERVALEGVDLGSARHRSLVDHLRDRVQATWALPLTLTDDLEPGPGRFHVELKLRKRTARVRIHEDDDLLVERRISSRRIDRAKATLWLLVRSTINRALIRRYGPGALETPNIPEAAPSAPSSPEISSGAPTAPESRASDSSRPPEVPTSEFAATAPGGADRSPPRIAAAPSAAASAGPDHGAPAPRRAVAIETPPIRVARTEAAPQKDARSVSPAIQSPPRSEASVDAPLGIEAEAPGVWDASGDLSLLVMADGVFEPNNPLHIGVIGAIQFRPLHWLLLGAGAGYGELRRSDALLVHRIPISVSVAAVLGSDNTIAFGLIGRSEIEIARSTAASQVAFGVSSGPYVQGRAQVVELGGSDLAFVARVAALFQLRRQSYLLDSGTDLEDTFGFAFASGVEWRWR